MGDPSPPGCGQPEPTRVYAWALCAKASVQLAMNAHHAKYFETLFTKVTLQDASEDEVSTGHSRGGSLLAAFARVGS